MNGYFRSEATCSLGVIALTEMDIHFTWIKKGRYTIYPGNFIRTWIGGFDCSVNEDII